MCVCVRVCVCVRACVCVCVCCCYRIGFVDLHCCCVCVVVFSDAFSSVSSLCV